MDRINELLANLAGITPEELTELEGLINARFEEISSSTDPATASSVTEMNELIAGLTQQKTEMTRRADEAAETARQLDEAKAQWDALKNPPEVVEDPKADAEAKPEGTDATITPIKAEDEPKADEDEPKEGDEAPAEVDQAGNPLIPVAASAGTQPSRGAIAQGVVPNMIGQQGHAQGSPSAGHQGSAAIALTAAAEVPGFMPNEVITDQMKLGKAIAGRLERMGGSRRARPGDDYHSEVTVAHADWRDSYPEERRLGSNIDENTRKINAVVGRNAPRYIRDSMAIAASGGVCLPVNVDYSVPTWATADRPLRDALPGYQADRGGIRFVTPPDIGIPSLQSTASGAGTGTGVWNEATDANPAGATKPVWVVACGTENVTYVNAVTSRAQFGNMLSRFAPEQTAANTEVLMSISAREAELELLTTMYGNSIQVIPSQYLGGLRDVLATCDLLGEQYLSSHRFDRKTALTAVFPIWAKAVFKADLLREIGHDNAGPRDVLAVTDAQIDGLFAARGINVIWTLDGLKAGTYGAGGHSITDQFFQTVTAKAAGTAFVPQWPGQSSSAAFELAWLLFVEGTFQYLDGGTLDLGVVRDSLLDSTNDYEIFSEIFEGIAFRGIEALQVISTIAPTGASAGTIAPSSYVE